MHIEFKDKFLYEQFNVIACKGKNWLPDSYGHSTTQGKGQPHSKAKVYKDPVNKPSFVDLQPKEEINIDNLLQAVKEIKNKNDVIQLNMLMENAS